MGFPHGSVIKNSPANARDVRDTGSILGLGRSPGERHGNPLLLSLNVSTYFSPEFFILFDHLLNCICATAIRVGWQEYWSGLPFSYPGDLPNPGIKPKSHVSCTGRQVLYH